MPNFLSFSALQFNGYCASKDTRTLLTLNINI
jgi:hypothetical protein